MVGVIYNEKEYNRYIEMKEYEGNWPFYMEGIEVSQSDMMMMKPFNTEYSRRMWCKYISNKNKHMMLLSEEEYPLETGVIYNYQEDWWN